MQNKLMQISIALIFALPVLTQGTERASTHRNLPIGGALVTPSFQNPIHPNDLSSSANPQYTIKSSGRYFITDNLAKQHNTAAGVILLINASNVSLDINSKTIVPHVSGSLSTGTAIGIARGKSNIQVMNGTIHAEDSSSTQKLNTGVNLSETTLSGGSGTSYSIKLQDLYITRCKTTGISGTAVNDLSIENCTVNDCSSTTTNVVGLTLTTVNNLVVSDCEFNNNATTAGTCTGILLTDCIDGLITNTSTSSNSASGDATGMQLATSSTGCSNLKIQNVNGSSNVSSAASTRGIFVSSSATKLVTIEDSSFNNNSSANDTRGIDLVGCTNSSVKRCQTNNNSSSVSTSIGVVLDSNSHFNHLEDLTANNNSISANNYVAGILVQGDDNNFIRCHANRNRNTLTSASSSAHAYGFQISGDRNYFQGCHAVGNSTSANAAVRAVGFYTTGTNTLNTLKDCVANANNASHTTASVVAAGIMFGDNEVSSQIVNCEAANNLVGNGTSSGAGARAYGIYFAATTGADQCLVKDCNIAHNSKGSGGSGLAFGFYDNDTASTSLLIGNVSIGHGSCLGTALDASLTWNGNSESTTDLNYSFKHDGTTVDPRNVIQEVARENFVSLSTAVRKWQNVSVYDAS